MKAILPGLVAPATERHQATPPIRIAAVQPGTPESSRHDRGAFHANLRRLLELSTRVVDTPVDLVVWPESAYERDLRPGGDAPRLILTATNIETGALDVFDSGVMQITPTHVLASGSLPPGFPATTAKNEAGALGNYWDGGLFSNTPLAPVINALENIGAYADYLVVVNLFPNQGQVPQNMLQVIDRMTAAGKEWAGKKAADLSPEEKKARSKAWRTEGIQVCIDLIKDIQKIEGVAGVHIMAIEWEEVVGEIAEKAGLLPRPN